MKFWARVALYMPAILLMAVVSTALSFVGFILVPLLVPFTRVAVSRYNDTPIIQPPKWAWLFGNDQEGWAPTWYNIYRKSWSPYWRQVEWAAWRNPVNNLRYVKYINPEPQRPWRTVKRYTWHSWQMYCTGPFARIMWGNGTHAVLVGWKISNETDMWIQYERYKALLPWGFGIRYRRPQWPM